MREWSAPYVAEERGSEAVKRRQRGSEGCVEAAYNIYTNECFSGTGERVECTLHS